MITQTRTFHAIATAVVPAIGKLDRPEWHQLTTIIEAALQQRPPGVRRQIALFLRVLNLLSVLRYGRALHRIALPERTRFLERIEGSGALLLRRGFWGVRTLVFMGYYARPEARQDIGYRAHARGWQARQ